MPIFDGFKMPLRHIDRNLWQHGKGSVLTFYTLISSPDSSPKQRAEGIALSLFAFADMIDNPRNVICQFLFFPLGSFFPLTEVGAGVRVSVNPIEELRINAALLRQASISN
jgi:hypothetical protein